MNRELLKTMDTGRIPIDRLVSLLQTFALKHASKALPDLLETADLEGVSNRQFLLALLEQGNHDRLPASGHKVVGPFRRQHLCRCLP